MLVQQSKKVLLRQSTGRPAEQRAVDSRSGRTRQEKPKCMIIGDFSLFSPFQNEILPINDTKPAKYYSLRCLKEDFVTEKDGNSAFFYLR